MSADINCPELSEDASVQGVIATWFAQQGQTVKVGQVLAEIAIDKVTIDIEAPVDGVITLHVEEGAGVNSGQLIATIE
jgi:pyruvate/2-oxoglutarate dehydrogenase complex dihydrolipoamide acyltransferase (E2) component